MAAILGDILPLAIGVAISPVPIIAVILILFSRRARRNGLSFVCGWIVALTLVGTTVLWLADAGRVSTEGTPSTLEHLIKLLFGLLFLYLALKQWRSRLQAGETPQMPKWMAAIDNFSAGRSWIIAALLAGVNPKNLGLTVAAALTITRSNLSGVQPWLALGFFVFIGSLTVVLPVLYCLVARQAAEEMLNTLKAWLISNNTTVMFILFLILGFTLCSNGLSGLLT